MLKRKKNITKNVKLIKNIKILITKLKKYNDRIGKIIVDKINVKTSANLKGNTYLFLNMIYPTLSIKK